MKKWVVYGVLAALSVTLIGGMTACGDSPSSTVVIGAEEDGLTRATVPVDYGTMTLSDVMAINAPTIKWSKLSLYTHTVTETGSALFSVVDTYGEEATLTVTYDAATDNVITADLSYGDITVSILTHDNTVLLPILEAMEEDYAAAQATMTTEATQTTQEAAV